MHILEFLTEITLVIIGIIAGVVGKSIFEKRFAKFTHLHHERADVVRELYRHLTELDVALVSTLRRFQNIAEDPLTEKVANLIELHSKLNDFYQLNKIFFSADICARMDNLAKMSRDVCVDITTFPVDPQSDAYKRNRKALFDRRDCWERARNLHENEMSEIRNELEREFRNLLGVDF